MARLEPDKHWWTAAELAASGLPGVPGTKRSVTRMAQRDGWHDIPDATRSKIGRGGGVQYHWSVLPDLAKRKLLTQAAGPQPIAQRPDRGEAWAQYDALPDRVKGIAQERLRAVQEVQSAHAAGMTQMAAAAAVARQIGKSTRTIYNWIELTTGLDESDWLAYLAPRHRQGQRSSKVHVAAIEFMNELKGLYLRIPGPPFQQCYRDAVAAATTEGWDILPNRTAQRRLERDVPRVTRVFAREGVAGLERCFPAQIRDKTSLTALESVNADCHKFDVFVAWPDGTVSRPQLVGFQDLYSRKILSWRIDHHPNAVMVMAAFGDMIDTWGIPKRCVFDNGREFANKWLTGGTPTRFRFKIRDDDPLGVLPLLGIKVHWAKPAHGQSKPIERAFRDLATTISMDPRFHGAYVGNRPDAKPEDYRSRAIPIDTFLDVVAEGIEEHNARDGRLTDTAKGRSFDTTFADSYRSTPIRKPTEEHRRLWMMGQHVGKLHQHNGSLKFQDNVYHGSWMSQHPGLKVVARFNPDDLHAGVFIYSLDGAFMGFAECQQKIGFHDLTSGRTLARQKAAIKRAEKELLKALNPLTVEEVAARKTARAEKAREDLSEKVVSGRFNAASRPKPSALEAPADADQVAARREATIHRMEQPTAPQAAPSNPRAAKTEAQLFEEALDILGRSERGEPVGEDEARWLAGFRETAVFRGRMRMHEAETKRSN
ncbi:MAG: transposase domain-containing protein [Pseudomonadota bacterium]